MARVVVAGLEMLGFLYLEREPPAHSFSYLICLNFLIVERWYINVVHKTD